MKILVQSDAKLVNGKLDFELKVATSITPVETRD